MSVLRLADQEYRLLLVQHHIVSDGWSMQRFIGESAAAYAAFAEGRTAQFAPLPLQYADYAQWQRDWLKSSEATRQLEITGKPAWVNTSRCWSCPPTIRAQLRAPARACVGASSCRHCSLRNCAPWPSVRAAPCSACCWRPGRPCCTVTAARKISASAYRWPGVAWRKWTAVLGCFINTLVLRGEPAGLKPFRELLGELAQASRDALANQELPFDQLVEALQPTRSLSHHPLFQVAFNHQQVNSSALGNLLGPARATA